MSRLKDKNRQASVRARDNRVSKFNNSGNLGFYSSLTDTPQVFITARSQASKPGKRKPSMPKMPWDEAE
jgi:hypothetical protein